MRNVFFLAILVLSTWVRAQLEVKFQADNVVDRQWARLKVFVKNDGTTIITRPKVQFALSVPSGEVPILESWYTGDVVASLEKVDETLWYVWFSFSRDLADGEDLNSGSGVSVGIHLPNYETWDYTTSPSFDGNTGSKVVDRKIKAWDAAGRFIWGELSQIQTPAAPSGESSVSINVGTGGRCNVTGTVYLVPSDRLDFWCQQDRYHLRPQVWVDGILHAMDTYPTILPDGKNHTIVASFPPRPTYPLQVISAGNGHCEPNGSSDILEGDSGWVSCVADEGAVLKSLMLNGNPVPVSQALVIPKVSSAQYVNAIFASASVQSQKLTITAKKVEHSSSQFAVYRMLVTNSGTEKITKGWSIQIPFRVPEWKNPIFNGWDIPGLNYQLVDKGQGWWNLVLTSDEELAPQAISGMGRGYYFAFSLAGDTMNWDPSGNAAMPSTLGDYAPVPYVRAYSVSGLPLSGKEYPLAYLRSAKPVISVQYKNTTTSDMSRPQILLRNLGDVALADFSYEYYFCTERGRISYLNNWYGCTPDVKIYALGGHCYALRYNFPTTVVGNGNLFPNQSGNSVGLYYSDSLHWDYSNDWSHNGAVANADFVEDPKIAVFDRWGNRIYGSAWTDPGNPGSAVVNQSQGNSATTADGSSVQASDLVQKQDVPLIVRQPAPITVDEDSAAIFEVRAIANGTDIKYQWRRDGKDLVGANEPVLALNRVGVDQDGSVYSCKISTSTGFVISLGATLHVRHRPKDLQIQVQPHSDTVSMGGTARFDVFATGDGPLTYQWYRGNTLISGATNPYYMVPVASSLDTQVGYWVKVKDANGKTIASTAAHLSLQTRGRGSLQIAITGNFSGGDAKSVETADLRFRLFSQLDGGAPLWSELHRSVTLKKGEWSVELGEFDPMGLATVVASQTTVYLEVVLDAGIPRLFGPRLPLTTVPFALQGGKRLIMGKGAPNRTDLPVGTLWMDTDAAKTWIRDVLEWKGME